MWGTEDPEEEILSIILKPAIYSSVCPLITCQLPERGYLAGQGRSQGPCCHQKLPSASFTQGQQLQSLHFHLEFKKCFKRALILGRLIQFIVVGDDALENSLYQTVSTSQAKQAHDVCTCVWDCMWTCKYMCVSKSLCVYVGGLVCIDLCMYICLSYSISCF